MKKSYEHIIVESLDNNLHFCIVCVRVCVHVRVYVCMRNSSYHYKVVHY